MQDKRRSIQDQDIASIVLLLVVLVCVMIRVSVKCHVVGKESQMECLYYLILRGFHQDPDELKDKFPSDCETWRIGDLVHPKAIMRYTDNGLKMLSRYGWIEDFVEHQVYPLKEEICKVECPTKSLTLVYYLEGSERPLISLYPEYIVKLGEMQMAVDVDLFYLGDSKKKKRKKRKKR
jgi:hypothetical protein